MEIKFDNAEFDYIFRDAMQTAGHDKLVSPRFITAGQLQKVFKTYNFSKLPLNTSLHELDDGR